MWLWPAAEGGNGVMGSQEGNAFTTLPVRGGDLFFGPLTSGRCRTPRTRLCYVCKHRLHALGVSQLCNLIDVLFSQL